MKKLTLISLTFLVTVSSFGQTKFENANTSVEDSYKKMKYDFPREKINGKNGGGYSLRTELLEKPVKRVALVTFYVEDPGTMKQTKNGSVAYAWTSSEVMVQGVADKFYEGISGLDKAFSDGGIELLLPNEYLDTEEKKEFFKSYVVEHKPFKKKKTFGAKAIARGSAYTPGVSRVKKTPSNLAVNQLFFYNEYSFSKGFNGAAKPQSMPTIGLYDKKQATSLGQTLAEELGVDAVLCITAVISKVKRKKEIYVVRNLSGYMWGPNPIQREEGKKGLIYSRGIFYCGTRAFYGKGLTFKDKKNLEIGLAGVENLFTAMGQRMTHYLSTGKRK